MKYHMPRQFFLLAVIGTGAILRLVGTSYGLPFPLVSDEEILIGGAFKMLELRTLLPILEGDKMNILYYPPALSYIYILCITPVIIWSFLSNAFVSIERIELLVLENIEITWFFARLTSVLFSTATIYITYRITRSLTRSYVAGVASAALLSIDFMHTMLGHVARHWSATVLLIWLAAWSSLCYFYKPTTKKALAIGIFSSLGFGTSYIGIFGIVLGLSSHIFSWYKKRISILGKEAMVMAITLIVGCALFATIHPFPIIRLLRGSVVPIYQQKTIAGFIDMCGFYVSAIWQSDPMLLMSVFFGACACIVICRIRFLAGMILISAVYMIFLYKALPLEDRYILPLIPGFAIFSSTSLYYFCKSSLIGKRVKELIALVLLPFLAVSTSITSWSSIILQREDTRLQAKKWIEQNLPTNHLIINNMNSVDIGQNYPSLLAQKQLDESSLRAIDRIKFDRLTSQELEIGRKALNLFRVSLERESLQDQKELIESLTRNGPTYYVYDKYGAKNHESFHYSIIKKMQRVKSFRACKDGIEPPMLRTTILITYPMYQLLDCKRFGPNVELMRLRSVIAPLNRNDSV